MTRTLHSVGVTKSAGLTASATLFVGGLPETRPPGRLCGAPHRGPAARSAPGADSMLARTCALARRIALGYIGLLGHRARRRPSGNPATWPPLRCPAPRSCSKKCHRRRLDTRTNLRLGLSNRAWPHRPPQLPCSSAAFRKPGHLAAFAVPVPPASGSAPAQARCLRTPKSYEVAVGDLVSHVFSGRLNHAGSFHAGRMSGGVRARGRDQSDESLAVVVIVAGHLPVASLRSGGHVRTLAGSERCWGRRLCFCCTCRRTARRRVVR